MPWEIQYNGKAIGERHPTQVKAQLEAIDKGLLQPDTRTRRIPGITPNMRTRGRRLKPGYRIVEVT